MRYILKLCLLCHKNLFIFDFHYSVTFASDIMVEI